METLQGAGCRRLPDAIRSLDEAKNRDYLAFLTTFIAWETLYPGEPLPVMQTHSNRIHLWTIMPTDSATEVNAKCELIHTWWREHGAEHHQVWRFWTDRCRPIDPRELVD